jgi:Circularly permutated YpsA SLOG family
MVRLEKIVSGGQTGADRAALDVAIELGIPHGGWISKGRKTERGSLAAKYQLKEIPTDSYPKRTEQNVIDSDGTLIISDGPLTGGSEYTRQMAERHEKPWIHADTNRVSIEAAVQLVMAWINGNEIKVLNVAGPRSSKDPTIHTTVKRILKAVLLPSHEET